MGCIDAKDWWSGKKSKWILIILCNIRCLETKATRKVIKFYYSEGESLYCAVSVLMSRHCALSAGWIARSCARVLIRKSIAETSSEDDSHFESAEKQRYVMCAGFLTRRHESIHNGHKRRPSTKLSLDRCEGHGLQLYSVMFSLAKQRV